MIFYYGSEYLEIGYMYVDELFGSFIRVISDRFFGIFGEEFDSGEVGDIVMLSDGFVFSFVGIY